MKDVFKELKVLDRKRKSCTAQINKDILETIFTSTSTFSSTILVTFLNCYLSPFQKKLLFLYLLCLLPRVNPLLCEWIFYGVNAPPPIQPGLRSIRFDLDWWTSWGCQLGERVCAWLTTPSAFFFPECVWLWSTIWRTVRGLLQSYLPLGSIFDNRFLCGGSGHPEVANGTFRPETRA